MLAMGTHRISSAEFGVYCRKEAFLLLTERAESSADQAALWRKTDPGSINIMVMMWQLISDGDLSSRKARRYLKAAIAALEELAPAASPIVDRAVSGYDCYLAILVGPALPKYLKRAHGTLSVQLIDSASAIECGDSPCL